jgi:hypothetical protein
LAFATEADRPRRGEKFSGSCRRRLAGVGRAEFSPFVAAVRNSPSVHVEEVRGLRRIVTGGEAKRVALRSGVVAIGMSVPASSCSCGSVATGLWRICQTLLLNEFLRNNFGRLPLVRTLRLFL